MKLEMPSKLLAVFVMIAVLATTLMAAGGSASAQTGDPSSPVVTATAEAVSDSSGEGVAAVPIELPLGKSDLVGSVMYRRSGEFERFDTDHDIDPPQSARSTSGADGASGSSGASGASASSEDREVIGSHYIIGNTFNVRVPASYAGKPAGVFAFSFNHVVLQAGGGRFTADCDNQRVFAYRDSGAARWRCDLDFGSSASGWAEAVASAAQVSISAAWSDAGCSNGEYGIKTGDEELLLVADCKALLAVKHHWFDEHPQNRNLLSANHVLRSWGSGSIERWRGVNVGEFHMTEAQFKDNCVKVRPTCPRRVLGVDLSFHGQGQIRGFVPEELGGVENSGDYCSKVASSRLGSGFGFGFEGVGCGLGALQILKLRGNALLGGIPWQLGNVSVAPCNPSVVVNNLNLAAAASLAVAVLAVLAAPFTAGLSLKAQLTLTALGVAVGVGSAFVDVDITLDKYFTDCQGTPPPPSRELGSGGGGASFERDSFAYGFNSGEEVGARDGELEKALFPSVLLATETAGGVLSDAPDNELITVTAGSFSGKVRAGSIKAAGRFASFLGALMDVNDIASDFFNIKEQEFLRLDRSQLQFLDLSGNQLMGEVPVEVGNLDSLEYLYLNENRLWGNIPGDAGRGGMPVHDRLVHLNVSDNNFSGGVPSKLSTRLRAIDFSGNDLGGSVPSSLMLSLGLEHLDLSRSGLSGELPATIANMGNLKVLRLNDNFLSGMVPSGIGKIHGRLCVLGFCLKSGSVSAGQLEHIDLSRNLFFGEIPDNLGNLDSLSWLNLEYNCFSGAVPASLLRKSGRSGFSLFYNYNLLDLSHKRNDGMCGPCFDGGYLPAGADYNLKSDCVTLLGLKNHWGGAFFPHRWGEEGEKSMLLWKGVYLKNPNNLSKKGNRVVGLDLSNLGLYGILPGNLANLGGLTFLWLGGNQLTGGIPKSFGNWRDFRVLDLSDNMLSGEIPVELGKISSPTSSLVLDLSNNRLTGEFPKFDEAEGVLRVYFSSIDLSGNKLGISSSGDLRETGSTPTFSRNVYTQLEHLDISSNYFTTLKPLGYGFDNHISGGIKRADYSDNLLNGNMPQELRYTTSLEWLDFSGNLLTGQIPGALADIANLEHLDLSSNCFSGSVPQNLAYKVEKEQIVLSLDKFSRSSNPECGYIKCTDGTYVPSTASSSLKADCAYLVQIHEQWREANGGALPARSLLSKWGQGDYTKIEDWPGVTVSVGRVTELTLENQGIADSEISDGIYGLTALERLDLSDNKLTGELTPEISRLSNLTRLDLSDNKLTGDIPQRIGRLTALRNLDLSGNTLTGEIPTSLRYLANLQVLNLSDNELSGRIPASLEDLALLQTLNLHRNRLSGSIPAELGKLSNLRSLKLQHNKLTGAIPEQLADTSGLPNIETVNLSMNCLLGPVPVRLAGVTLARSNLFGTANDNPDCRNPCRDGTFVSSAPQVARGVVASPLVDDCVALWAARKHWNAAGSDAGASPQMWGTSAYQDITTWPRVTISRNRVREIDLSVTIRAFRNRRLRGTVPAVLGDLAALEILNLSGNLLRGEIPARLHQLGKLKTLNLSRNLLSGSVPASLGRLASLVTLDLSRNRLTGQAPSVMTHIFTGRIPTLARPQNLESLYLNDNQFEGIIPPQITSHANLKALRLNNNNLHGPIPASIVSLRLLSDLRLNDNNLTGPAPRRLERMISLRYLYLQNNCLTGQDPGPTFRIAFIYYTTLSRSLGGLPSGLSSLPEIKTQNNLFDNAATENKTCGQICRESVANPSANTQLVRDCETLLEIRDNWAARTTLPEGSAMATWGSGKQAGEQHSIDRWQGVTIKNNRVAGLDLSGHAFTDSVPIGLANLKALTSLNLSNNQLSSFPNQILELEQLQDLSLSRNLISTLPENIDNLTELTSLDLSIADISDLPGSISNLKSLTSLNLDGNSLGYSREGVLDRIGTLKSLTRLYLSRNLLEGSVLDSIENLTSLTHLDLRENRFSGPIPAYIGNLTALQELDISFNRLSGPIPSEIGSLRNLEQLKLYYNNLSGAIPPEIGNLRGLKNLDLSFSLLSGPIPSEIGNLQDLEQLNLSRSRLSGSIPSEIGNLRNLENLTLSHNRLSGSIPSEIGNLLNLKYLSLSTNRLSGSIPSEIGNLLNLKGLSLSTNRLSGSIPSEIGNLLNLKYLSLSTNRLSGSIPSEIGNLLNLKGLSLSTNRLSGSIPSEIGNLRNLESLSLFENRLSGPIPSELGNLLNLRSVVIYTNNFCGPLPATIWRNVRFRYYIPQCTMVT